MTKLWRQLPLVEGGKRKGIMEHPIVGEGFWEGVLHPFWEAILTLLNKQVLKTSEGDSVLCTSRKSSYCGQVLTFKSGTCVFCVKIYGRGAESWHTIPSLHSKSKVIKSYFIKILEIWWIWVLLSCLVCYIYSQLPKSFLKGMYWWHAAPVRSCNMSPPALHTLMTSDSSILFQISTGLGGTMAQNITMGEQNTCQKIAMCSEKWQKTWHQWCDVFCLIPLNLQN